MTVKLRISPDLILPADVITATTTVYGGKGMGKTNCAAVLIEELSKAGLRWSLLDPMGVAWGLRHSKDGKGPGVSCLILGGVHGDIPIEPTGGAVVADLVVDEGANVIIDFSRHPDGKMWSNGERVRFVTDYAIQLFARQGSLVDGRRREPLLQIIDEAARYIPQVIPSGAIDLARCVGAWEQICEEGRNIGLGVMFLTQRSARMAKAVSELSDVMFAFRTIGPNSLDAVLDWLGQHVEKSRTKELAEKVRALDVGQALVVSPGWLKVEAIARIRERETFDSSATPKAGQKAARVTGAGAKPDLALYREKMAATIERAKENDPKALKATIADLRKELARATKPATVTDPKVIERAIAGADKRFAQFQAEEVRRMHSTAVELRRSAEAIETTAGRLRVQADTLDVAIKAAPGVTVDDVSRATSPLPSGPGSPELRGAFRSIDRQSGGALTRARAESPSRPAAESNGDLPSGERKILIAVAQNDGATREQLTILTGYKKSSRDAYLQRLQAKGFVLASGRDVEITDAGETALGRYDRLPTGDDLREYWLNRLPEGESKILTIVCHAYPKSIDRDAIDAGYQKSSRDAYIQRLAARKLVSTTRGAVMASPSLFDR